jgi:hypothetical protein
MTMSSQNKARLKGLIYQAIRLVPEVARYLDVTGVKTQEHYNRQMWFYCLSLFRGEEDAFAFISDMTEAISEQLTKAWNEGARAVGIEPDEFTSEDKVMIDEIIKAEYEFILGLGSDIEAVIGTLELKEFSAQFRPRVDVWAMRYQDVVNRAKAHFGNRTKLVWRLGPSKKHCGTCSSLNGIVAYAKEWEASGVRPQSPPNKALQCGGWNCKCNLEVTTERRTRNALQRIQSLRNGR